MSGLKSCCACGRGRQVDLDVLRAVQLQADHHEGGQQKEHDVNQRNDLNPRVLALDWRRQFHCFNAAIRLLAD